MDALVSVCEGIYNRSDIARVGQVLLDEGLFEAISSQEERFIDEYEFYSFVVRLSPFFLLFFSFVCPSDLRSPLIPSLKSHVLTSHTRSCFFIPSLSFAVRTKRSDTGVATRKRAQGCDDDPHGLASHAPP